MKVFNNSIEKKRDHNPLCFNDLYVLARAPNSTPCNRLTFFGWLCNHWRSLWNPRLQAFEIDGLCFKLILKDTDAGPLIVDARFFLKVRVRNEQKVY